jgi:hypothetical protein
MTQSLDQLWVWFVQTFGVPGALIFLLVALFVCLGWLLTPVYVWRLYRRSQRIEQALFELRDRSAAQGRQQQVERLQRDKSRQPPRRRRRRRGPGTV